MSRLLQINLHNYRSDQAIEELDLFLDRCMYTGVQTLLIITGRGLHSRDGRPVIKPKVLAYLHRLRYKIIRRCRGSFLVRNKYYDEDGQHPPTNHYRHHSTSRWHGDISDLIAKPRKTKWRQLRSWFFAEATEEPTLVIPREESVIKRRKYRPRWYRKRMRKVHNVVPENAEPHNAEPKHRGKTWNPVKRAGKLIEKYVIPACGYSARKVYDFSALLGYILIQVMIEMRFISPQTEGRRFRASKFSYKEDRRKKATNKCVRYILRGLTVVACCVWIVLLCF